MRAFPSPLYPGEARFRLTDQQRTVLGRSIIAAGCAYELVALVHPKVPTISHLLHEGSNHRMWRFAAWCAGGFALDHIYGD
jgi:hypothetical protein